MVTFKSPIWNPLIEFIDKLRDFPSFEAMNEGKYKKRLDYIYNRAMDRMRLDKTDFDLLSQTFIFLNEKDITAEEIEYMNENVNLGYKCVTTADGRKIIKEAEVVVKKRKEENEFKEKYEEKRRAFEEAEARREKYLEEHNKINNDWETARIEFEMMEEAKKNFEDKTEVEDSKEEVINNE